MAAGVTVQLSADTKALIAEFQKASATVTQVAGQINKKLESIDATTKQIGAGGFSKFQASIVTANQALDLISRTARGAQSVFQGTIGTALQTGDTFSKLSQKVGVSVESISSLQLAAQLSDVSIEQLSTGLGFLNRSLTDTENKNSQAAKAFAALGVNVKDAQGNIRGTDDVLLDIADAFANAEDSASKTAVAMALFGRSGKEMIPLLNQGSAAIREQQQLAQQLGVTFTTQSAKAAEEFNDTLTLVGVAIQGVSVQIAQALLPDLVAGAKATLEWVQANKDLVASKLVETLQSAAQYARDLAPQIQAVAGILGDLLQAYSALPAPVQQAGIVGVLIGGKAGLIIGAALAVVSEAKKLLEESAKAGNPYAKFILGAGDATTASTELAGALGNLRTAQAATTTGANQAGAAHENAAKDILKFSAGAGQAKTAADRLAESQAKARAEVEKELALYKAVSAGALTLTDALKKLEVEHLAVRTGSRALAQQYLDEKQKAEDLAHADELIVKNAAALKNLRDDEARQSAQRVRDLQFELTLKQQELQVLQQGITAQRGYDDTLRDVALAHINAAEAAGRMTAEEAALERQVLTTNTAIAAAQDHLQNLGSQALLTARDLGNFFDEFAIGIIRGSQDLENLVVDFFEQLGVKAFKALLVGKNANLDIPLIGNITQLVGGPSGGIIGGIFGQGGSVASGNFGSGFLTGLNVFRPVFTSTFANLGNIGADLLSGNFLNILTALPGDIGTFLADSVAGLGSLVGKVFPSLGAQINNWAPFLADPIVGAVILAIASIPLIMSFFNQPGRIQLEKGEANKFFEKVFTGVDFKIFKEKKVAGGFAAFPELDPGTQALGALFAKSFGEEATQGTIIRFAGQFLANLKDMGKSSEEARQMVLQLAQAMGFELGGAINDINSLTTQFSEAQGRNLLSLGEFEEEVAEARRNLSKYGDTSQLTAKQLSELAIANGNTGSKIVTLNELYAGAIDLATGFSEAVDAQGLANALLADRFTQVATAGGDLTTQIATLRDQIADGSLSIEEAALMLNEMRAQAGLAKLELQDFTLDPEQVVQAVGVIQAALEGLVTFGQGLGGLLEASISAALSGEQVNFGDKFDEFFDATLRTAIVKAMVAGFLQGAALETLQPLFEQITTLVTQLATKAISPDEFRQRFGAVLTDNADAIAALKTAFGAAGEAVLQLLSDLGLLPDGIDAATNSAQGLVDKFQELSRQIEDLARKRVQVQIDLLADLRTIGAITPLQEIQGREAALLPELNFFQNFRGPIATRPLGDLSDAQLTRGLEVLQQAQDLAVQRYQAEVAAIQEALQAQLAAIHAEYEAKREAVRQEFAARREATQARIDELREERQATQALFQSRLDGLREELRIAQDFQRLAQSLQQQINAMVTSAGSPISGPEQLALLSRQADALRAQILAAAPADRVELIQQLAAILQQQLQLRSLLGPEAGTALFNDVLIELENLRAQAQREGDKAGDLQQKIAETQAQMASALANIDAQIEQQQKLLSDLSRQEQAAMAELSRQEQEAVAKAQAAADASIKELREKTAQTLTDLAAKRDEYLQEQIKRLEEQREITKQQLIEQFGEEEAERLLADPMKDNILALGTINESLLGIKGLLDEFLSAIRPTAHGAEGVATRPQLRLIGERGPEYYSIRPVAIGPGGGAVAVHVNVPNSFTIRVDGNTNATQAGAQAARAFVQTIIYEAQHGQLGQVIDDRARRVRQ